MNGKRVKIILSSPHQVRVFSSDWSLYSSYLRKITKVMEYETHYVGPGATQKVFEWILHLGEHKHQRVLLPTVVRMVGMWLLGSGCDVSSLLNGMVFEDATGLYDTDEILLDILDWAQREVEGCSVGGDLVEVKDLQKYVDLELYPHQVEGIRFLMSRLAAGLFFEMRLGKTITALIALERLREVGLVNSAVVVAPLPTVSSDSQGWERDYRHTLKIHNFSVVRLTSGLRKIRVNPEKPVLFLTHYDYLRTKSFREVFLPWLKENYRSLRPVLILDESHRIKNPRTVRFRSVIRMAPYFKRYWLLTGTPMNSIEDIWAQSVFLGANYRFGSNITQFRRKYMIPHPSGWGYLPRSGALKAVKEGVSPLVVVAKQSSVFRELKVYREEYTYTLTSEQRKYYRMVKEQLLLEIEEGKITTVSSALVQSLRLMQICSGHVQDGDVSKTLDASNKLKVLKELLEDLSDSDPVVVWHQFNMDIPVILGMLEKEFKSRRYYVIRGSTPQQERMKKVEEWVRTGGVLLTKPSIMGEGVNLSAAKMAIYWNNGYSFVQRHQSESRILSPSSRVVVLANLYAPRTIEEKVLRILEKKKSVDDEIKSLDHYVQLLEEEDV